jgi:hypothetical protein
MNIETNKVRIISDKTNPPRKEMIGKEYKICRSDFLYNDNSDMSAVLVLDNKQRHHLFYKSDVRFLTPIKFKDRHVAIKDKVKFEDDWYEVISFAETGTVKILFIGNERGSIGTNEDNIQDHDPGIETDDPLQHESEEVKKAVETLTRQGYKVTLE